MYFDIIYMLRVTKKFRVVFDSVGGNFFRMILPDREVRFQRSPNKLYYFDAADRDNIVLLLETMSENQEGFTCREYEGSWEARQEMNLLGFLLESYFENMVR